MLWGYVVLLSVFKATQPSLPSCVCDALFTNTIPVGLDLGCRLGFDRGSQYLHRRRLHSVLWHFWSTRSYSILLVAWTVPWNQLLKHSKVKHILTTIGNKSTDFVILLVLCFAVYFITVIYIVVYPISTLTRSVWDMEH